MTNDTERLFDEASEELGDSIRDDLSEAEENLPGADDVWAPEGENIIGTLNQLQSLIDYERSIDSVKDAQKSFLLGEKADAFSDADVKEFENRISQITDSVANLEDIDEMVGELIPLLPELRGSLAAIEEQDGADSVREDNGSQDMEDQKSDVDTEDESGNEDSDSEEVGEDRAPAESWGG